jgi:hypothetical protein
MPLEPQQMQQLKQQMQQAAETNPLLIYRAVQPTTQQQFYQVANQQRFQHLQQLLGQQYTLTIAKQPLVVTENLVYWALAEMALHDDPTKSAQQQHFKTLTNQVLVENGFPENNETILKK